MIQMTDAQLLITILAAAAVTLLTRALPFLIFPEHKRTPAFISYLGSVLPYALIAMLVVYCFKAVDLRSVPHGIPELIASAFVIFVHRWKRNLMLSIGGGTLLYMILIQFMF